MTAKKSKKRKVRFIEKVLLALNILAALCLLFSLTAAYVSPVRFWPLAFFGLAFPFLALLNLFFIILWLFLRRYYFLLSLVCILAGWKNILNNIEFNGSEHAARAGRTLKVMSFNVRLFDYYNWRHNKESRDKIFRFIRQEAPDIVCFQEFFHQDDSYFPVIPNLVKELRTANYHVDYATTLRKTDHYGTGTFSVWPIVGRGVVKVNPKAKNYAIFSDILFGKDTIRVYNLHLESIRFSPEDYMYFSEIGDNRNGEKDYSKGPRKILAKLRKAFVRRAPEAEAIAAHIKGCRHPIVLCGDFNDTPASYTYHVLSDGLNDAFRESGSGIGNTYAGIFPSFRIDYILYDSHFSSSGFRTHKVRLSDHYPVSCLLELK